MRKKHKRIRNGVVALTTVMVGGLFIYGQRVHVLTEDIEYRISVEQTAVDEKKEKLADMERQLKEMDSLEYIKKVATEELKMVESDVIVFKEKE